MLHDVGFISTEIIPYSSCNNYLLSHEQMLEHCIIGEELIRNMKFETEVTNVIMFHHEKYDGTGFFGVEGNNIPLYSRLIAIADNIDILFNLNNIKDKEQIIIDHLNTNASRIYDPQLINYAIEIIRDYKNIAFSKRCDLLPQADS